MGQNWDLGQNWEEKQPLEVGSKVEMPEGTPAAGKLARYIGEMEGYTHVYVIDEKATYVLPAELAKKLRRPFDVGDTVMCMFGDTTVGATIVKRDAWGDLTVQRADNGWKVRVAESQLKRIDPWPDKKDDVAAGDTVLVGDVQARVIWREGDMCWLATEDKRVMATLVGDLTPQSSVEKLKARFPEPPEGMFWDLTASVDEEGSGAVTFEVCLNVEGFKGTADVTYRSVEWSEDLSESEVFEEIILTAEDLAKFFPTDTEKFKRAQEIGMAFERKTRG